MKPGGAARGFALVALVAAACAEPLAPATEAPPSPGAPLHVAPLTDLVPAAGLQALAELHPRALLADPSMIAALADAVPEAALDALARQWGGVDLRAADELVVATYDAGSIYLVRQVLDPAKLEAAFTARVAEVQGRAIDQRSDDPRGVVVRLWGGLGTQHEGLVVWGREAAGLAVGEAAPGDALLRAPELFAAGRLKRARPAWRAAPLDRVAVLLGDAPARAAAPGPFAGRWAAALGGLLATATAAGIAWKPEGDAVRVTVVVTGAWGDRAAEARARLERAYASVVASGLGALLGLDSAALPAGRAVVTCDAESLRLEVRLRPGPLLRGLRDATTADVHAIMSRR